MLQTSCRAMAIRASKSRGSVPAQGKGNSISIKRSTAAGRTTVSRKMLSSFIEDNMCYYKSLTTRSGPEKVHLKSHPAPHHEEEPDVELLLHPKITVVGVGGGGGNTVNTMIKRELTGVEFVVANTDAQVLKRSAAHHRIQLGKGVTKGLGAGASPDVGRQAAEESIKQLMDIIGDSHMVFLTAGMGGGTGTGATPVIAQACKKRGILTVAIVTTPFEFEGLRRAELATQGIQRLQDQVDTIITVPNQKLLKLSAAENKPLTFSNAFEIVDDILYHGVQGVTDLIVRPGLINLDFADVKTIMTNTGRALLGTGEAEGENRGIRAAEQALYHPLLSDIDISGAKRVLINVTGGSDLSLFEVNQISDTISAEADPEANIIFGTTLSEDMKGRVRVSIFVTDLSQDKISGHASQEELSARHKQQQAQRQAKRAEPQPTKKGAQEQAAQPQEKKAQGSTLKQLFRDWL